MFWTFVYMLRPLIMILINCLLFKSSLKLTEANCFVCHNLMRVSNLVLG